MTEPTDDQIMRARLDLDRQCKEDITTGCSSSIIDSAARLLASERVVPAVVTTLMDATEDIERQRIDDQEVAEHIAHEVEALAAGIARGIEAGTNTSTDALHSRLRDLDRALVNIAFNSAMGDTCKRLGEAIGMTRPARG